MAPLTRSGKRLTGLNIQFAIFFFLLAVTLPAQTPFLCSTSATNQVVRAEGLAEPVGSILLNCTGTAGQVVNANLTVTFPTAVTNRLSPTGNTVDQILTVDTGSGPVPAGTGASLPIANTLVINGITATVPASRTLVFRLQNIRLAIAPLSFPAIASISSTALSLNNATATVATPMAGLLSTGTNTGITCTGSTLPATLDLPSFFAAGTRFNSLRVTEGFGNAFVPKDAASDTGTRIIVNYSNVPAGGRLFLPDYVAGNSATQATAAGDLGGANAPTGGIYTPTVGGTLLLARVIGHDANGAGGAPIGVASSFTGPTALKTATEVSLTGGAGVAVYEVIDASPTTQESAQFPTFLGLNGLPNQAVTTANVTLSLAPVSAVATATSNDPVPRFRRTAPPSDCTFIGDCSANYFPVLSVAGPAAINFRSPLNGLQDTEFFQILNTNPASVLTYSASVVYANGAGFVFLDPTATQGTANATLRVIVNAAGLAPGTYNAQIIITAGSAGSRTIPVTVTVDPPATPPAPVVTVTSVTNAATLAAGPLVPGSLGTVKGANLAGTNVVVTFDGIAASILYKSATQINFQVPAALVNKTTTQLVVTVDGKATPAQTVTLAAAAPGVFGALNQDGTLNSASAPAAAGTVLQIFATGLATDSGFQVSVSFSAPGTIGSSLPIVYAGPAPGIAGVQQVNVTIPALVIDPVAGAPALSGTKTLNICSASPVTQACTSFALFTR